LAALCNRAGIDEEVRGADEPFCHGCRGLDGEPFVQQGCINALAQRGQGFRQDNMLLSALPLDRLKATGVHDGTVRAPAVTDGFVGSAPLMFEPL